MTYDCVFQRRMRSILKSAVENRALVASLFPEAFRNRLFRGQEEAAAPVFTLGAPSRARLSAMLGTESIGRENKDLSFLSAKPIADLFPHCTVLFADISGFSAWSSEREPEQVFTLLETIFQTFDKIARRRSVFKVETIGDTYVAVTGLPDPQEDHAIVSYFYAIAIAFFVYIPVCMFVIILNMRVTLPCLVFCQIIKTYRYADWHRLHTTMKMSVP